MNGSGELAGRRELGRMLRKLRMQASVSGRELARRSGISQSKISRMETGECVLNAPDVASFCNGLNVDRSIARVMADRARELAGAGKLETPKDGWYHTSDLQHGDWLWRRCRNYAFSTPGAVPVLLQTEDRIAHSIDSMNPSLFESERAQMKIVRLERQLQMHDTTKSFRFLIDKMSLRRRAGSHQMQLDQLRSLLKSSMRPNVEIRYVGDDHQVDVGLSCWYAVHDADSVVVDGIDSDRASTSSRIVDVYRTMFEKHWNLGLGGDRLSVEIDRSMRIVDEAFARSGDDVIHVDADRGAEARSHTS